MELFFNRILIFEFYFKLFFLEHNNLFRYTFSKMNYFQFQIFIFRMKGLFKNLKVCKCVG